MQPRKKSAAALSRYCSDGVAGSGVGSRNELQELSNDNARLRDVVADLEGRLQELQDEKDKLDDKLDELDKGMLEADAVFLTYQQNMNAEIANLQGQLVSEVARRQEARLQLSIPEPSMIFLFQK